LVEITEACGKAINIEESKIGVREDVRGACEILGFDPMYLANEGRFVLFVPEKYVDQALSLLSVNDQGAVPSRIGSVGSDASGVILKSIIGANRIVDMFTGEQLPRIC